MAFTVVIDHDDLPGCQGRQQHLLDIGFEGDTVHTALERHRSLQPVGGKGGEKAGVRTSVAGHLGIGTLTRKSTGIAGRHGKMEAALVNKDKLAWVEADHLGEPAKALRFTTFTRSQRLFFSIYQPVAGCDT